MARRGLMFVVQEITALRWNYTKGFFVSFVVLDRVYTRQNLRMLKPFLGKNCFNVVFFGGFAALLSYHLCSYVQLYCSMANGYAKYYFARFEKE